MYDFDQHVRFITRATEAAFGYAALSMAAAGAWQDQALDQNPRASSAQTQPDMFNPFSWMAAAWQAPMQPWLGVFPGFAAIPGFAPMRSEFGASFFDTPVAQPFAQCAKPFGMSPSAGAWQRDWSDAMIACCWAWPQASWMMWHQPMTAALMSYGMPYPVASQAARANAAAMDAADAARDTFKFEFSSYQSGGGHASSQIAPWSQYATAFAPWLALMPQFPMH